jgi:tetratricopeptide (TPR) repeat protein
MAKNCINSNCEKEIPSSATFCSFCGTQQVEEVQLSEEAKLRKEMNEMQETIALLKKALADAQQNNDSSVENLQVISNLQKQLADMQDKNKTLQHAIKNHPSQKDSKNFPTTVLLVGLALLLIVGSLVGYFAFYKPYAIDRDASRFYTFATNTFLRSSQEVGVDYNKLGTLPYGSELITYDKGSEWSEVKWKNTQTGEAIKGYISSDFILSEYDFKILNSIWGDNESKEVINTGKCRIALLNYVKEKGYASAWQVFSKSKNTKPNTTYYARITNKDSKFTDFAVIIKNVNTGERKCLLFSFDDDETPHLVYEEDAPAIGDIGSISYEWSNYTYYQKVSPEFNIQYR